MLSVMNQMNRKQTDDKNILELEWNLQFWKFVTVVMVAIPVLWVFTGSVFMVFIELDELAMPYTGPICAVSLFLASISGWLAWRKNKQVSRYYRLREGRVRNPAFRTIIGGSRK
jgi:hypothetical protein